jgi:hypothetical protein
MTLLTLTGLRKKQSAMLLRADPQLDRMNGFFVACFERCATVLGGEDGDGDGAAKSAVRVVLDDDDESAVAGESEVVGESAESAATRKRKKKNKSKKQNKKKKLAEEAAKATE